MTTYAIDLSNCPCEPGEPEFRPWKTGLTKWELRSALREARSKGFVERFTYYVYREDKPCLTTTK